MILLIIIILVSVYLIYKNWDQRKNIKINTPVEKLTQKVDEGFIVSDSYESKNMDIKNDYVKIDVKYPHFKKADAEFNLRIENFIKSKVGDHITVSQDNWQARYDTQTKGENIPKTPMNDENKFLFTADFTIIQSNSNFISFIENYGGFTGGAHGYEENISFNYNVKNKKILTLKELFSENFDYLKYLSDESRIQLKKEFVIVTEEDKKNSSPEALQDFVNNAVSSIEGGTETKEENFSIFTFAGDKIRIYFAQYQVGPYVIGMPEVEVDRK